MKFTDIFVRRPVLSLVVSLLILLIGGFIIASTGIAGLYVGKIFEQVKGRPLYVIDQAVNRGADRA